MQLVTALLGLDVVEEGTASLFRPTSQVDADADVVSVQDERGLPGHHVRHVAHVS